MNGRELKRHLAGGGTALLVNPDHVAASLAQKLATLGADAVFIDCEHGPASYESVEAMARAVRLGGAVSIVRPECDARWVITRYLNRGIDGVMVPLVHTAEQCKEIVSTVRYACPEDHDARIVVVMIESMEGVRNLPSILQVEGIDVFFVGPGDLSQSMGFPPRVHAGQQRPQEVVEAVDHALRSIREAGRVAGTLVNSTDLAEFVSTGAQLLYLHTDELIKNELSRLRQLLPRA